MMKRVLMASAALALSAALAQAQEVKIGLVAPFTGIGAELGQQIDRGVQQYLKLRADEFKPYKINIIKRDDKNPSGADSKIAVQGVWMMADPAKAQASAIAPHTVLADTQPRSMTTAEVQELIEAHAIAASHAEQAGADGFEFPISGGAGVQSFTSEFYNQRTDQYGGSLENRMRIVVEIIAAIR